MLKRKSLVSITSVFMALLMILMSISLPVGAASEKITADSTVQAPVSPENKIDSELKEKMATASPDEKIPVAIWYEDVDQEQIDTLTTQKVGFSRDDIAEDYEMPSTSLLTDLKNNEDSADAEMQAYMERTKKQREKERKRTDEFIMTRREFSRTKYNEKSAKIIKDVAINEEDITFKSQYAPMIIAELTVLEIETLKTNDVVTGLYYDSSELSYSVAEPASETDSDESSVDMIKQVVGYTELVTALGNIDASYMPGDNIKIGVVETGGLVDVTDDEIDSADIEFIQPVEYDAKQPKHMTGTVKVIVGETDGFLTGAKIICSNESYNSLEQLITAGVHVINASVYISHTNWIDHIVSEHSVTVVAAVGNTNIEGKLNPGIIYRPASGYNVIGVGAYYLSNSKDVTIDKSDDRVAKTSAYKENEYHVIEKPDVIMPYIPPDGGTSYATPILTSFIAMMYQLKPSLALYPQAVKAIVLASCHRKVNPSEDNESIETMEQGITERQGAGAPDVFTMASIVSQGTYGVGRIGVNATQGIRRFVLPSGNTTNDPTKLNVSITWLRNNAIDEGLSHNEGLYLISGEEVNLDLRIYRNNQLVGSSLIGSVDSTDDRKSTTEMAYIPLDSLEWNYEIRIQKAETYNDVVRYGYAYSTDKPYLTQEEGEEGIYYIRNYVTDKYLTLNENNEAVMTTFTGAENQKWVVSGTPGAYEICPAYGDEETKINFGAQVGSNPYYKAVAGTNELNLSIDSWETNTALEPDAHVFTTSAGGSNNILSYTSTTGIFVRSTTASVINMYRMWVLEDINYRVGDVNMDGKVNISDATTIQKYVGAILDFNNAQCYLADYNNDGKISTSDATEIQKYAVQVN